MMRVKIEVEFDVPGTDEEDVAKAAARMAAFDYLCFCTITGVNPGRESCEVHVDGYDGELEVKLGDN